MHRFPENHPLLPLPLAYTVYPIKPVISCPCSFSVFCPSHHLCTSSSCRLDVLFIDCELVGVKRCVGLLTKAGQWFYKWYWRPFHSWKTQNNQKGEMARMALLHIPKEELWLIQRFHLKTDTKNAHRLHSVTPSPHSQGRHLRATQVPFSFRTNVVPVSLAIESQL